jgi:hypothetical protein
VKTAMAFSYTAPIISEEEEKAEYDDFTDTERNAIKADIYGHEESFLHETDEMTTNSLLLMFREAIDCIPNNEKLEYLEAIQRAPEVVERECKPISFLRVESFDPCAAAKRLAAYWKVRKATYGSERAFLPMTLDGAMREDIRTLELGHISILPPDRNGRPVYFINRVGLTNSVATHHVFVSSDFLTFSRDSSNSTGSRS